MDLLEQAKNFVAGKLADLPKPEATVADVDLKGIGLDGLTFLAKVSVSNPYAVPIPICEIAYKLHSAGRCVASGNIPDPGSLTAHGTTPLDVTVKVPHSAVISLIRDIGADWDVDYVLELGFIVDLPIVEKITIPVSYKGEMKLPTISEMIRGKPAEEVKEIQTE